MGTLFRSQPRIVAKWIDGGNAIFVSHEYIGTEEGGLVDHEARDAHQLPSGNVG